MGICRGCRFDCGGYCSVEHDYDELEIMSDCDGYSPLRVREAYDKYGDVKEVSFKELRKITYKNFREI